MLFISAHEWPLYPGSGRASEVGRGPGRGYTLNIPVPPGTGDEAHISIVRDLVMPVAPPVQAAADPDLRRLRRAP